MPVKAHLLPWAGLWCGWVIFSRNNHPTLPLNMIATGILLAAFAAALYFNWLVLVPRLWQRKRYTTYWGALLVIANILTAVTVVAISSVYDLLWGPDPRRFGFWVNYGLDLTGMCVHLAGAAVIVHVTRWRQRRRRG